MITAAQLATKVKELRDLQKQYFKTRDLMVLTKCKRNESEVDRMVESVLAFKHPETLKLEL